MSEKELSNKRESNTTDILKLGKEAEGKDREDWEEMGTPYNSGDIDTSKEHHKNKRGTDQNTSNGAGHREAKKKKKKKQEEEEDEVVVVDRVNQDAPKTAAAAAKAKAREDNADADEDLALLKAMLREDDLADYPESYDELELWQRLEFVYAASVASRCINGDKTDSAIRRYQYAPYYERGGAVSDEQDNEQFEQFRDQHSLIRLKAAKSNKVQNQGQHLLDVDDIATAIANLFKIESTEAAPAFDSREKVMMFFNLVLANRRQTKKQPRHYPEGAISTIEEWIQEEERGCSCSTGPKPTHSIGWYHCLFYFLAIMIQTEIVVVLPPDGECANEGSRHVSLPEEDYSTMETEFRNTLVFRLIIDRSVGRHGDGGQNQNVIGVTAHLLG